MNCNVFTVHIYVYSSSRATNQDTCSYRCRFGAMGKSSATSRDYKTQIFDSFDYTFFLTLYMMTAVHKFLFSFALLVAVCYISFPGIEQKEPPLPASAEIELSGGEYSRFKKSVESFSHQLFKRIVEQNPKENAFVSPSSISISLGMLFLGPGGDTREEIKSALNFDSLSFEKIAKGFLMQLSETYYQDSDSILHMSNQLWADRKFHLEDSFIFMAREFFRTELQKVDFLHYPNESREHINAAVAKHTADHIQNILPDGSVDLQTKLVITNAIYFKGDWKHPFDKENTQDKTFTLLSGETVEVPTMFITKKFFHTKQDELHILELPYKDQFSMIIYFPENPSEFDYSTVPQIDFETLKRTTMDLEMPKFKIDTSLKMSKVLSAIGLGNLFTHCDLSGISDAPLYVDEIYHQAFVETNEQGTEASAATAVVVNQRSLLIPQITLSLNHPFLFEIRNTESSEIIFAGMLTNPSQ